MSARSNDTNEDVPADNRPTPVNNGQWNQQTIVDARNVLQTQQSSDTSQQSNEQRPGKSKMDGFSELTHWSTVFLIIERF